MRNAHNCSATGTGFIMRVIYLSTDRKICNSNCADRFASRYKIQDTFKYRLSRKQSPSPVGPIGVTLPLYSDNQLTKGLQQLLQN